MWGPSALTRRTAAFAGAAVLGAVVLLAVVLGSTQTGGLPAGRSAPSAALSVPSAAPAPVPGGEAPPPPDTGAASALRLEVPSVGLLLPLLPLTPEHGVIDPPTMGDSYWITPYGGPDGHPDNTVYIAGHSWTKGPAAFNALMPGDHSRGVTTGDLVQVHSAERTVDYAVTSTQLYDKDQLPDATAVWAISPGRLVLITCFVDDDGRATDENFVVFAES